MKAVILAAGQGTRIRPVHGDHPKCLIQVGDSTILDHQLEALSMAGVDEVAIVVGYEKEQIMRHVRARHSGARPAVHFIENPAFAITNNIYSLWRARDWLCGDSFVCLNADVIFDPEVLCSALRNRAPISMIVDREWRNETMKVVIFADRVILMSKKISREQFSGTYIGVTVFQEAIVERFLGKMKDCIAAGRVHEFFNVAVQELADEGVRIGYTITNGQPWAEIDDPLDLTFARHNVFPQLAPLAG